MSSIRSILEELNEYDTKKHPEFIDQALKDISELIDGAKPYYIDIKHAVKTKSDAGAGHTIGHNEACDQYQSNLKELLK